MLFRAFLLTLLLALPARAETRLLLFEQPGCIWCERWQAEVGHLYHRTPEGRAAPLVRVRLGQQPDGIKIAPPPHFTPTFVLAADGRELGRIEGYPGEAFFWALLGQMLAAGG